MGKNIFGMESESSSRDGLLTQANVVPVGDEYLSTITIESSGGVLYRHEQRFATLLEAQVNLRAQLESCGRVSLDDLQVRQSDEYDEPFDWREHRSISAKLKKKESEEEGEFDTHVEDSIGDVLPKQHYFSRRHAMMGGLEHYSAQPNLKVVDPRFYGTGISGAERRRKANDPATWVDRAYFYEAGAPPEAALADAHKYIAQLPAGAQIYDMAVDPQGLAQKSKNEGGVGLDLNVYERKIKDAGYFGFKNSNSAMSSAVAIFYPLPVQRTDGQYMGELLLTTVFVKRAGSTENYLQSIGAQPDVIQFIAAQPPDIAKRLVNEVRKNSQITADQLRQMAQGLAQKQKYEPTQRELALANRYERTPGMPQWVLLQAKKYRAKKVETPRVAPNFPPYEFEYKWPAPEYGEMHPNAPGWSLSFIEPVFNQISDWVNATQVQIASYDLSGARAASDKWHEEQAAQGAGHGYEQKNVAFTLPNGWTIQRVLTENDLQVEGNLMGHCVGSYCTQVSRGNTSIYSLRDPQNQPHATIEIEGSESLDMDERRRILTDPNVGVKVVQIQGKGNKEPIPEYKAMIKQWFQSIGPENIEMEGSNDSLYDRLYNAEPEEMADILEAADSKEGNEYGIPRPAEEFDGSSMQNVYEHILNTFERRNRRDNTYFPRQMNPVAYALADLAWNSDMQRAQSDWSQWSLRLTGGNPEGVMEIFQKSKSAMAGIWREMDKHQEEFDRFDFNPGFRMEDFETEEKFYEAESEARDEAYREWLMGGFDMAVNDRWRIRAKETRGKQPYTILEERLTSKKTKPKSRRRNAA